MKLKKRENKTQPEPLMQHPRGSGVGVGRGAGSRGFQRSPGSKLKRGNTGTSLARVCGQDLPLHCGFRASRVPSLLWCKVLLLPEL